MTLPLVVRLALVSAGLSLLTLAACGGDDSAAPEPPDPLQPYRTQIVQWRDCDTTGFDEDEQEAAQALGDRVQCADIRAPIDYDNPGAGDLSVAVLRVAAAHGGAQRQALLFNPGGPGGDGLSMPLYIGNLWMDSTDATETGRLQQQLLRTYDLVGFSPRGVGSSTQLLCASGEQLLPTDNSLSGRTPENIALQLRNTELIAHACRKNPLTPHINTESTAQDMDLIRELMGDSRLNYIGWSYGTWLGLWYGSRFPDKVGHMLLDSSVDYTATLHNAYLQQPPALTRAFNDVLAPYAARHPDVFELGDDPDAIRGLAAELHPSVQQAVSSLLYAPLFNIAEAETTFNLLLVGNELSRGAFVSSLPTGVEGGDFERLSALVEAHDFSPDPDRNETLRDEAHNVVEKMRTNTLPKDLKLAGDDAVYTAVVCNDTPPPSTDVSWWTDQETQVYRDYPLAGIDDFRSCLYWTRPESVRRPAISALQDAQILMLQSQYDGATNAEGARKTFALLPAAHLLYVPGEMTHSLYPYNDCVDLTVARYFLDQPPAQRELECPATPLPEDLEAQAGLSRMSMGPQGTYADPGRAKDMIAQIKSRLGRAGAGR